MIDSNDSQLMPLSFVATSVSMSLSSCSRNIKGQFGTLFFFQIEISQEHHMYHAVKHVNLTFQEKAGNVMT